MAPYTEGENASVAEMMASSTAEIVRELITAHKERKERVKKAIVYLHFPKFSILFMHFLSFRGFLCIFFHFKNALKKSPAISENCVKFWKVLAFSGGCKNYSIFELYAEGCKFTKVEDENWEKV